MALEFLNDQGTWVTASTAAKRRTGDRMLYKSDGHNGDGFISGIVAPPGARKVLYFPYDYDGAGAVTAGTATLVAVDPIDGNTQTSQLVTGSQCQPATLTKAAPKCGYSTIVPSLFGLQIENFAATGETVDIMIEIQY
jgi:hypothetical protein